MNWFLAGGKRLRAAAVLLAAAVLFAVLPQNAAAADAALSALSKGADTRVIYFITCMLSLLLFLGYLLYNKNRQFWFSLLFCSVFVVNLGYLLMGFARTLSFALWANRIAYFGSALLPLCMMVILLQSCRYTVTRPAMLCLGAASFGAFALAASGGVGTLYYKEVTLKVVNGVASLSKVYGPLHPLYAVYLLGSFIAMLVIIAVAVKRKTIGNFLYAVFLLCIVLANLLVWGVEQLVAIDFEFLSISYIATVLMLLLVCSMVNGYNKAADTANKVRADKVQDIPAEVEELFNAFVQRAELLTVTERSILRYYSEGREVNEVAELAFISIHTVRKHNMNMYKKLDVSSREELMLYLDLLRRCGRLQEVLNPVPAAEQLTEA
ncbi:MAG: hypothetical protein IKV55_06530 [Oscillospiraceae bacterium]|nr:hypothetical protein [Oscillospiraceae bacterium]